MSRRRRHQAPIPVAGSWRSDEPVKEPAAREYRKPTIIELAEAAALTEGVEGLTPNWESTLKAFYALPLTDDDIRRLCNVTHRSKAFWEGRRGGEGTLDADGDLVQPFRELWARVGRRGRKTSTTSLICTYENLYGGHEKYLMAGEFGRVTVLSRDKDGSAILASFLKSYCDALGLEAKRDTIGGAEARELVNIEGTRFHVAIAPPNKRATRGPASPVIVCDEFAHIGTEESESANSDVQVLAAAKPSMAQFPNSKLVVISSPLGEVGLFHATVEANLYDECRESKYEKYRNTKRILAVEGPSWEWGTISEQESHELEPDPEIHAREYGAKPSGTEGVAFVKSEVQFAFKDKPGTWAFGRPCMFIDSSGGGNTFSCAIIRCGLPDKTPQAKKTQTADGTIIVERDERGDIVYEIPTTKRVVRVSPIFGFTGEQIRQAGTDEIVRRVAEEAKAHGCEFVFGDQYGAAFLGPLLRTYGVEFRWFNNTQPSKHESVITLRWLFRDGLFSFESHERMQNDLETYPKKITGARFVYGHPPTRGHHNDYASAIIVLGTVLNGIALGDGMRGMDANGHEFWMQYAPTRYGVSRSVHVPQNNFVRPELQQSN